MYTAGLEVRSRAFLLAEYIKNLLFALCASGHHTLSVAGVVPQMIPQPAPKP